MITICFIFFCKKQICERSLETDRRILPTSIKPKRPHPKPDVLLYLISFIFIRSLLENTNKNVNEFTKQFHTGTTGSIFDAVQDVQTTVFLPCSNSFDHMTVCRD